MTIKKKFQHYSEKFPDLSSVVCLGRALMGTPHTVEEVKKLTKLLDKEDYSRAVLPQLVAHLARLSKQPPFDGLTKPRV